MNISDDWNGWTNWETWIVFSWIDDNETSRFYWRVRAEYYLEEADYNESKAIIALARDLRQNHLDTFPVSSGVFADLIHSAINRVEWAEVAESIVENVPQPVYLA